MSFNQIDLMIPLTSECDGTWGKNVYTSNRYAIRKIGPKVIEFSLAFFNLIDIYLLPTMLQMFLLTKIYQLQSSIDICPTELLIQLAVNIVK